jgi:phosphoribosylformylglycinamidine cyclo-ligase
VKPVLAALEASGGAMDGPIKALSHITGGGLSENLPRVLPPTVSATIDLTSWQAPAVFGWLAKAGRLSDAEMLRTFNCGIGMVAVVESDKADALAEVLRREGEQVTRLGEVVAGQPNTPRVIYDGRLDLS